MAGDPRARYMYETAHYAELRAIERRAVANAWQLGLYMGRARLRWPAVAFTTRVPGVPDDWRTFIERLPR